MKVAVGKTCYTVGIAPVNGVGFSWSAVELGEAIDGPVSELVFDDAGNADLATLLASVADTDFGQQELAKALATSLEVENWRVGEAVAEAYLTDHRSCYFPWPDGRDHRNPNASLPGADLVGFHEDEYGNCFAFGEVKTSNQAKYPPNAMYGRSGMIHQLETLRDYRSSRDTLLKYLGHRAKGATWLARYHSAVRRYLANVSDVRLFGVLIRDVTPHEDDVRTRVQALATDCPNGTIIELISIYFDPGSISTLAAQAGAAKHGGA